MKGTIAELEIETLEKQAREWLSIVLEKNINEPESTGLGRQLTDGEILLAVAKKLCKLTGRNVRLVKDNIYGELQDPAADSGSLEEIDSGVGRFALSKPGLDRLPSVSRGSWMSRSNVHAFLQTCRTFGLSDMDLCTPSDVVDEKNLRRVYLCLRALSRKVRELGLAVPDFDTGLVEPVKNKTLTHSVSSRGRSEFVIGLLSNADSVKREDQLKEVVEEILPVPTLALPKDSNISRTESLESDSDAALTPSASQERRVTFAESVLPIQTSTESQSSAGSYPPPVAASEVKGERASLSETLMQKLAEINRMVEEIEPLLSLGGVKEEESDSQTLLPGISVLIADEIKMIAGKLKSIEQRLRTPISESKPRERNPLEWLMGWKRTTEQEISSDLTGTPLPLNGRRSHSNVDGQLALSLKMALEDVKTLSAEENPQWVIEKKMGLVMAPKGGKQLLMFST